MNHWDIHWDNLPDYYHINRRNRNNSNYFSFVMIILISCTFLYGSYYYCTISMEENKHKTKEMDHLKQQLLNQQRDLTLQTKEMDNLKQQVQQLLDQQRYINYLNHHINILINDDKTGIPDFALGSQGAKIVRLTDHTENYGGASSMVDGLCECDPPHGPNLMIHTDSSPGNCWAFKGVKGGVVIRLFGKVFINSISIEHISKNLSPSGNLSSAPKHFTLWGMENDKEKLHELGRFYYDINGPLIQTFHVRKINYSYEYVEVQFLSNHGNPEYTCVYRLRVHGTLNKNIPRNENNF